ncbi:MAG TPA: hypothetical protein VHR88_08990 [Solirubrobacteraceae bacterium]|jgi:predicted transcriptional regulator of viral defense system|nr:hypothetical protein [Solirubrobacteraceae bacterium]
MDPTDGHSSVWELARRQHGVIARRQLLAFGFDSDAIKHRLARGRLHPVERAVYAVGRPELTQHGRWMAAILAKGPAAVLSHRSAASLYDIARQRGNAVHVSVAAHARRRSSPGITVHRRKELRATQRQGVPVTRIEDTLIDLATQATDEQLEQAINEAAKRDLIDPGALREAASGTKRAGAAKVRTILDGYVRTDSPLERTTAEQAADRARGQDHFVAGLTAPRFTSAQVRRDRARVEAVLRRARLA